MSSREIAEMTGKNHADVMRDIRNMLLELHGDTRGLSNFASSYMNSQNKEQPCFVLPKRETLILTSGYSITQRSKIIDRWQELESQQIPKTLPEALRLAADLAERNSALENKIETDAPKVEFAMAVRRMEGSCKIGDFSKVIGIGRTTMFAKLRADEILMADNMPYQRYIDAEYFVVIEQTPYTDRDGKAHPTFTTMLTGKGQVWIERKYRKG
jgi:Rha family phage regulatory protein